MTPTSKTARSTHSARRSRPLGSPARFGRVRRFAWVAFITLLIWVWADLEQTKTENLSITMKVVPPPGSDLRIVAPTTDGVRVHFTCRGPQGRINDFRRRLQEDAARGVDTACVVQADSSWSATWTLTTEKVLNSWQRLRDANLTAETPDVQSIVVEIDRWIDVVATVELRTTDDASLVEPDKPTPPAKVMVRVPASRYDEVADNLVVFTEPMDLTNEPADVDVTRTLRLTAMIGSVPIKFVDPPQAEITFRIDERTVERSDLEVPVRLLAPPELWEQIAREGYVLSRDPNRRQDWRLTLTIKGPRKEVERVTAEAVHAFVTITEYDLKPAQTYPDRQVTVVLPPDLPNIELVKPRAPMVHYRFDSRANGE